MNTTHTEKIIEFTSCSNNILFSRYYYLFIGLSSILITIFFIIFLNYDLIATKCNNIPIIKNIIKIINYLSSGNKKKYTNINSNNDILIINNDKELDEKYTNIMNKIYEKINKNNFMNEYRNSKYTVNNSLKKQEAIKILDLIKRNNNYIKSNYVLRKIIEKMLNANLKRDDINNIIIDLVIQEITK